MEALVQGPDQPAKRANKSLDRGFASLRVPDDEPSNAREVTDAFLSLFGSVPSDAPWFAFVEFSDTEAPYDSHGSAEVTAGIPQDTNQWSAYPQRELASPSSAKS